MLVKINFNQPECVPFPPVAFAPSISRDKPANERSRVCQTTLGKLSSTDYVCNQIEFSVYETVCGDSAILRPSSSGAALRSASRSLETIFNLPSLSIDEEFPGRSLAIVGDFQGGLYARIPSPEALDAVYRRPCSCASIRHHARSSFANSGKFTKFKCKIGRCSAGSMEARAGRRWNGKRE